MIFEKIKTKVYEGKLTTYYCFGKPIFQNIVSYKNGKRKHYHRFYSYEKIRSDYDEYVQRDKKDIICYLKINSTEHYSMMCLGHWIDVCYCMGMKFIIVCDKPQLEKLILKNFKAITPDTFIFMKSKAPYLLRLCQKIQLSDYWCNAGQSHLITYYHSIQNGYSRFWNIDADDTFFSIPPRKIAEILTKAEFEAESQKIDNLSLDMHTSRTNNNCWSFGITYTKNIRNYDDILRAHNDWMQFAPPNLPNLDNFFTALRNKEILMNKIFYVENALFYHWGALYNRLHLFTLSLWSNKKILFPFTKMYDFGKNYEIPDSLIKIDIGLDADEEKQYLKEYFKMFE